MRSLRSSLGRGMGSPSRCWRRIRGCWRRRDLCLLRRSLGSWMTWRWQRGCRCFCGTRCRMRRCGNWPISGSCTSLSGALRAQTRRLLDDPEVTAVRGCTFTDYWLDLRKIDDTSPSSTIYNDYELDDPLKQAAVEETRLFFAELVQANLPAKDVVDSDFTFLNERLAKHYGIAGVEGAAMRKVMLPKDSPCAGVMTQAAVLKVTANGTNTSPVIRGHWITERILGIETPATTDGQGGRAGHSRGRDHSTAVGEASCGPGVARRATARWTRPVLRRKVSM